ncbi:MAG: hypothetical protein J6D30_02605 [Clostridia bacterium]|nr:hypothetical protein [Clostridia bacterium]
MFAILLLVLCFVTFYQFAIWGNSSFDTAYLATLLSNIISIALCYKLMKFEVTIEKHETDIHRIKKINGINDDSDNT